MYLAELGKIMYQHKVGLLPNIFNNTFTLGYQTHGYNTRNGSSFHVPKSRINMSLFSFRYQGLLFFNSLSPDIQNSSVATVATFKNKLKKYILT